MRIGGRFLKQRIQRCTKEKGVDGAIVPGDFYEKTGVVTVAAALNKGP